MSFQIYSGARFIGSSDLDNLDPPMGIASGDFLPSKDYHMVQSVFRLYAVATVATLNGGRHDSEVFKRYYRERDNLDLTVRLSSGEVVPMQCVHIEDFSAELGGMSVTIAVSDDQAFAQYFELGAVVT